MRVARGVMMSDRTRWVAVPALLLGLVGAESDLAASGRQPATHSLRVSRFVDTELTKAQADAIIKEASIVLDSDGPDDVGCDVKFVRDGMIETFTTRSSTVLSQSDFVAVLRQPGDVKVVERVNWCRGGFNTNVVACSYLGDSTIEPSLVVGRTAANQGIVWAHEFGHLQGLTHRSVHDVNALMNKRVFATSRRVNQEECSAYRSP